MLVTVGATEAIAASVLGLVEPGSEVLLIEPFYDSYSPVIAMAGCHRRAVPLRHDGRGFAIDIDGLRRAVTPKTKALIVNSPHNPTGMVATDDELRALAELAVSRRSSGDHRRGLRTPRLRRQASPAAGQLSGDGRAHHHDLQCGQDVQLSPAGRSDGPAAQANSSRVRAAKQYLSYVGGAPFQPAVAQALATEDAWVDALRDTLQARRDRLGAALTDIGFDVHDSFGTYFVCADPRPLGYDDSTAFCAELPERAGVAAIPMSAFCDPAPGTPMNGITWCASLSANATTPLDEAIRRLGVLRRK